MTSPLPRRALRAAIYCRISLSRFGDTLKVDDQEKLCRDVAHRRGWTVAPEHIFRDNSQSAWRRDRRRPRWDAMLEAVNSGRIDAIIVYHGDRLVRQIRDLEDLIDLADRKGIRLASPTGDRDLDDSDDRFVLRILAAQACKESDNTSRRMKRDYERLAERGLTRLGGRGGRAFGFEPDGLTIREDDAEMIRDVARRILTGSAVGEICRDLNAAGYRTTASNPWDHGALKKLMKRPRIAGLLARHGTIIGPAAWDAILDRETWESVVAVLDGNAGRFNYCTNARRYLLSGIAVCGTPGCGKTLAVRHNVRGKQLVGYGCINPACPRKVHRAVHHLDVYVGGYVVRKLCDDQVRAAFATPASQDLSGELAKLEAKRHAKLVAFADDDDPLAADVLRVSIGRIDERIAEVRARMTASQASHVLDDMWDTDLASWKALGSSPAGLTRQRAAVQALVRVVVLSAGRRGPGFDPETVVLEDVYARASRASATGAAEA